jgi:PAS domain S-box-containing protein
VILADMLVIGAGIIVAAREVLVAEHRTEASDARLEAIVDSAMDAIITVDAAQNIVLFNRAAEQMFGCPRREAIGRPLDRFIPARFRSAHRHHVEHFARTGVTSRRMGDVTTLWGAAPRSGDEFPIEASISQAGESGKRYFTVILRDITVRKQAEDALRQSQRELRELSARVLEAREEEKAHIARELHDELGQLLTALKMDLGWLRERTPAEAEIQSRMKEMGELLDRTGQRDAPHLGRPAADDARRPRPGRRRRLAGRRLRQALGGRRPHRGRGRAAGAFQGGRHRRVPRDPGVAHQHRAPRRREHAWVVIGAGHGSIHLEVEDDGRGFAPEDLAKSRSLGLKGMRERIAFLGGSLEVARAPRGGTRLKLSVPL